MRFSLLVVLFQLCVLYRYSTRATECALSAVRTELEPSPLLGNPFSGSRDLLIWKSTFHYCGYVREVRYVDQTILKSYEVPKRLTLYRSVLGTGERDWFILQIIVEWVLLGALALGYTMYKDGVLLFAIHSMVRGIDRALGVN
jgi:hypothetical protein